MASTQWSPLRAVMAVAILTEMTPIRCHCSNRAQRIRFPFPRVTCCAKAFEGISTVIWCILSMISEFFTFFRIVAPNPGPFRDYDQTLYRNASMPQMHYPQSQVSGPPNDLWQRTRSMPNSVRMAQAPSDRRISTASSNYSSGSIDPSYPPSSAPSGPPYFYKYSQPLCKMCAACTTCGPTPISRLSGNTVPNFVPQVYRSTTRPGHPVEDSSPVLSDQSGYTKSSYSQPQQPPPARNPAFFKSSDRILKSVSAPAPTPESIEYEKWKANYGKIVGRGMKKGLNKLTSALLYT